MTIRSSVQALQVGPVSGNVQSFVHTVESRLKQDLPVQLTGVTVPVFHETRWKKGLQPVQFVNTRM